MSVMINLLPWREVKRERQTRRFYVLLVAMLVLGTGLSALLAQYYQAELEAQRERNRYITTQTRQLEADIRALRGYQDDASALSDQLALFQTLQKERVQTVHLFNGVTQSLADGVVYRRLARSGDTLSATADAGSNRQASEQLRRIEQMPGLGVPVLAEIRSEGARQVFRFDVQQQDVALERDAADDAAEDAAEEDSGQPSGGAP